MNQPEVGHDQVTRILPSGFRSRRPILSETIQKHPKISAVIFSIALAVGAIENCNSKNANIEQIDSPNTSLTSE